MNLHKYIHTYIHTNDHLTIFAISKKFPPGMCQFAVGTPTDKNTFTILTISLIYFTLYYMENKKIIY